LCDAADQAADLEDDNRGEESGFEWEVLVALPPCGLKSSNRQEEGTTVPADLIQGVEVIGDSGDCSCDDGLEI